MTLGGSDCVVGALVGSAVGSDDGSVVGALLASVDGVLLGEVDGNAEGVSVVGAGVGADVSSHSCGSCRLAQPATHSYAGAHPHCHPSFTVTQTPPSTVSHPWLPSAHAAYVGAAVGSAVGALVGAAVGSAVGASLGVLVGVLVGSALGALVGS